jgi:Bacterial Ig domain
VFEGVLANYILDNVAAAGEPSIPRFTDLELLNNAGIFPVVADTTPPTVSMALPLAGATVWGSVLISANAADDRGVLGVQFQVDGANLGSEDTTPPYSRTWNATNAAPGAHVLRAIARDAAGNVAVAQVTVTVVDATPPTVTLTSPASGSQVSGTVTIQASASDNVGVAGVTFSWNGTTLGPEVAAAPYRFTVPTNPSHNGTVTLMAVARDTSGNTGSSSPVTITVNNPLPDTTKPTVAFTAPANNATVSNTVTVAASAGDNVGVRGVQFKLDGNNLGAEDTVAPYAVSWNTTTASSGLHLLTATARDAAGNTTTATLTVNVLHPQTLYPASYAIVNGAYQSGGLPSLGADDNNHLVVRSSASGFERTAQAELVFSGVASPVTRLDVSAIFMSSASNTSARIHVYDFTSGAWVQLNSSTVGTTETTRNLGVSTNAARYVGPTGTVRLRIQTSKLLSTHTLSVEMARLTVTH